MAFGIMCFSWNTGGVRICETGSRRQAKIEREGLRGVFKSDCLTPDFFEDIRTTIQNKSPGLVVMTTEDEGSSRTYFHSHFLPTSMLAIQYSLLTRDKLESSGESLGEVRGIKTGQPSGGSLRISIYVRDDIVDDVKHLQQPSNQTRVMCNTSGAIAAYVSHRTFGKFLFIAAHLPTNIVARGFRGERPRESEREIVKTANSLCLLGIYDKFIETTPDRTKPNNVFILGDLNYEIIVPTKSTQQLIAEVSSDVSEAKMKSLLKYDELKSSFPLKGFMEGIGDAGPNFMPTWNLTRERSGCSPTNNKVSASCFSGTGIGWHDRILYKNMPTAPHSVSCKGYSRIDVGNMIYSTHAGVVGLFELSK